MPVPHPRRAALPLRAALVRAALVHLTALLCLLALPSLAEAGRSPRPTAKGAQKPAKVLRPGGKARATTTLRFGAKSRPAKPKANDLAKPTKPAKQGAAKAKANPAKQGAAKAKTAANAKTKARLATKTATAKRAQVAKAKVAPKAKRDSRWSAPIKAVQRGIARLRNTAIARMVATNYARTTAKIVRRLDAWQARAPPWLAKSMDGLRTYTLPSIAAYMFARVANDKAFLGTFLIANSVTSNIILPGSIAFGLDPVLSTVLNIMTTPVAMGVIVMREQYLRRSAGEELSLAETAKAVGAEYRDFAKLRRAESSRRAQLQN